MKECNFNSNGALIIPVERVFSAYYRRFHVEYSPPEEDEDEEEEGTNIIPDDPGLVNWAYSEWN